MNYSQKFIIWPMKLFKNGWGKSLSLLPCTAFVFIKMERFLHLTLIESGTLSEEETGSKVKSASDAAAFGDLAYLQEIAEKDPTLLFQKDENLWQPIHEAARSGNLAILEYLVAQGADINARTYFNQTVLDAALYFTKDETHPLIQKLRELGATSSGIIDFEVEDEETEEEADELEDEEADALADEF